ncbi:hypothetical protein N321_00457, partial [Antrostomus carolinensis]
LLRSRRPPTFSRLRSFHSIFSFSLLHLLLYRFCLYWRDLLLRLTAGFWRSSPPWGRRNGCHCFLWFLFTSLPGGSSDLHGVLHRRWAFIVPRSSVD